MTTSNLEHYNCTKKYFLNLYIRNDKLVFTRKQVGEDFIKFTALYPYDHNLYDFEGLFRLKKSNKVYKALLSETELFRSLSHFRLYESIARDESIADNDFVLIAEDGNSYVSDFKSKLNGILKDLKNPRYEFAELVLLSSFRESTPLDFVYSLNNYNKLDKYYNFKLPRQIVPCSSTEINIYDFRSEACVKTYARHCPNTINRDRFFARAQNKIKTLVDKGDNEEVLNYIVKYDLAHIVDFNVRRVRSYTYESFDSNNQYLGQKVYHLFPLNFIRPVESTSCCYLIRKKACVRILKQHARPYWYTSDFKQFIPVQNILMVSPLICSPISEDAEFLYNKSAWFIDQFALLNRYFRRTETLKNQYHFIVLKYLPFLQFFQYSSAKPLRVLGFVLEKVLFLRYFGRRRG